MNKILYFLGILTLCDVLYAVPKNIEVWFLNVDSTTFLEEPLYKKSQKVIAQRNLQCQPMGEYCFDPQVGLYKKEEKVDDAIESIDQSSVAKQEQYKFLDTPKGVNRQELIECDKDSHFLDLFCGKAKNKGSNTQAKVEVWVDVSSTMKQVDFSGFDKPCKREFFLKSLSDSCSEESQLKIYFFEEFRKQAGMLDRVCLSGGLNNMKNIISDLKRSKAERVLIITDIFEAQESFLNELEALGPTKIKGIDKPFYANNIKKELARYRKFCK